MEYGRVIIMCALAIVVGTLMGNGTVYFFNKIPGAWLCDYGQEPSEELLHPTHQRIRSTPWKYIFSGLFIVIAIKLAVEAPVYGIAALIVCWLMVQMAIADIKYMIVPDQLIMLLVVAGLGFITFQHGSPIAGLWGALIGFGVMMLIGILGKLIYRKDTLGGGDIKHFAALVLATGVDCIIVIFILTTLISGAHTAWLLMTGKIKITDQRPMVPYIAVSTGIHLVLLREISYNVLINLGDLL